MDLPRDRDREVKFLENSGEILENQEIQKFQNFGPNDRFANSLYIIIIRLDRKRQTWSGYQYTSKQIIACHC